MTVAAGASVLALPGKVPSIADGTFVADGARLIGEVSLAEGASVW
jgi:carbonic anhydrase/acetyltransferase-like protein (isoleucine patch superfamily)